MADDLIIALRIKLEWFITHMDRDLTFKKQLMLPGAFYVIIKRYW